MRLLLIPPPLAPPPLAPPPLAPPTPRARVQAIKYGPHGSTVALKVTETDYALVPHHFTKNHVVAPTDPAGGGGAKRAPIVAGGKKGSSFMGVIPDAINYFKADYGQVCVCVRACAASRRLRRRYLRAVGGCACV